MRGGFAKRGDVGRLPTSFATQLGLTKTCVIASFLDCLHKS